MSVADSWMRKSLVFGAIIALTFVWLWMQRPMAHSQANGNAMPDTLLLGRLTRGLQVRNAFYIVGGTSSGIGLADWTRTDLRRESLEPFARRALDILLITDSAARRSDTLFVQFSDPLRRGPRFVWAGRSFPFGTPPVNQE